MSDKKKIYIDIEGLKRAGWSSLEEWPKQDTEENETSKEKIQQYLMKWDEIEASMTDEDAKSEQLISLLYDLKKEILNEKDAKSQQEAKSEKGIEENEKNEILKKALRDMMLKLIDEEIGKRNKD
ncbi:MAG: hypothetical protein IPN57_07975 [Ignavibacteria bacterium]|nr:hypothetical protein [Ignavibacteria bacterium]